MALCSKIFEIRATQLCKICERRKKNCNRFSEISVFWGSMIFFLFFFNPGNKTWSRASDGTVGTWAQHFFSRAKCLWKDFRHRKWNLRRKWNRRSLGNSDAKAKRPCHCPDGRNWRRDRFQRRYYWWKAFFSLFRWRQSDAFWRRNCPSSPEDLVGQESRDFRRSWRSRFFRRPQSLEWLGRSSKRTNCKDKWRILFGWDREDSPASSNPRVNLFLDPSSPKPKFLSPKTCETIFYSFQHFSNSISSRRILQSPPCSIPTLATFSPPYGLADRANVVTTFSLPFLSLPSKSPLSQRSFSSLTNFAQTRVTCTPWMSNRFVFDADKSAARPICCLCSCNVRWSPNERSAIAGKRLRPMPTSRGIF